MATIFSGTSRQKHFYYPSYNEAILSRLTIFLLIPSGLAITLKQITRYFF